VSRVGQVWWARRMSIAEDYAPHVVLREINHGDKSGWALRPLERIAESKLEICHYESQFATVEAGGADAWINSRLA